MVMPLSIALFIWAAVVAVVVLVIKKPAVAAVVPVAVPSLCTPMTSYVFSTERASLPMVPVVAVEQETTVVLQPVIRVEMVLAGQLFWKVGL